MGKYYFLYNPKSGNGTGKETAGKAAALTDGEAVFEDITAIKDYPAFFAKLQPGDAIVICGGDGTLSRFADDNYGRLPENKIYHFSSGTGNDFQRDIGAKAGEELVEVGKYIVNLPTVVINGAAHRFINGVGYGIDGYCCEEGDRQHEQGVKNINYTSIAIKGLLFHYKPKDATIIVDGKEYKFKKAWLAPTMNGRYYGGGMNATPAQDRLNNSTLSTLVMYGKGKIKTLMVFPSIFKGEHVNHKEMVEVLTGRKITVRFESPAALQIDGETVTGVNEYTVTAPGYEE